MDNVISSPVCIPELAADTKPRAAGAPFIVSWVLFSAIAGFYLAAALRAPMLYIWGTYEDLVGEWFQFWCFVGTFLMSVRLICTRWRYRWFFGLLALATFYVAMEEISWGQRVFQWNSPDLFKQHNLQGETNLHNFFTGPYKTMLKEAISWSLGFALIGYGLVYPLTVRFGWRPAMRLDDIGFAAPPLAASPFFVMGGVLETGPFSFNEGEVAEIMVGCGIILTVGHYVYTWRHGLAEDPMWTARSSWSLGARMVIAVTLLTLLAGGTTWAMYRTEPGRERIDQHIENGIAKFAGRYRKYERWDMAAMLYTRLHELRPHSMSTLRKLAATQRELGNEAAFAMYANLALEHDMERYDADPTSASVNRSLARTYWLLERDDDAELHIGTALSIGEQRITDHPDSAAAWYSYGRTLELMGHDAQAVEMFKHAWDLEPTTSKYKKAYLKTEIRTVQPGH